MASRLPRISELRSRAAQVKQAADGLNRQRESEYRATIDAFNLFFGAVVGINFATLPEMPLEDYAFVLVMTSMIIALILVVPNTSRRVIAAIQMVAGLAGYYHLVQHTELMRGIDEKMLVTLGVWGGSALLYVFTPRDPDPDEPPKAA